MASLPSQLKQVPWLRIPGDLSRAISAHRLSFGAAAIAYQLLLAIFPAMIALLTLLPYLPIPHLQQAITDALRSALPGESASLLTATVSSVLSQRRGGLLSVGTIGAIWAASSGMLALMEQLNFSYEVKEERGFFKTRGVALLLTLLFGILVVGASALVVLGGSLQDLIATHLGRSAFLLAFFAALRWVIIAFALTLEFALVYYLGPDVEQRFRWVSPGALLGVVLLVLASLAIRLYTDKFADYDRTYGSIGAVIVLALWLYVFGFVLMLGSEINSLVEHYAPEGKQKGQKRFEDAQSPGVDSFAYPLREARK